MPDKKEVLKALVCRVNNLVVDCTGCPYNESSVYWKQRCNFQRICRDALALLKEREEGIEPEISRKSATETTVSLWYKCGACGGEIEQGDDKFCRHCGKKVKWYE
jgi:hypothetical protein